jgi:hypothetical protein
LFLGAPSSSWPLTWPMSIFIPLPHMQQSRGPGGGCAAARYLNARSVTVLSVRPSFARAGRVSPGLAPLPPLLPPILLRETRYR